MVHEHGAMVTSCFVDMLTFGKCVLLMPLRHLGAPYQYRHMVTILYQGIYYNLILLLVILVRHTLLSTKKQQNVSETCESICLNV